MLRWLTSLQLAAVCGAGCAASSPELVAPLDARECAAACAPLADDEPMLERVEGQDVQYYEVPQAGECPLDADELPPFSEVDDSGVPEFDMARMRLSNMYSGDESLPEQVLLGHLQFATSEVFECLSLAACYEGEEIGRGEIEFAFEVEPAGRVRAVNVAASEALDRWGLVACARRAIYETRFPAYDGGSAFVRYTLELD